ncbi:MAG: hypothetical protein LBU73_06740 [Helicobacteraceae bacterium]|jgi:uncharacterized protein with HEPN domain|nr:hypothetical protein [Helicobacteraceae bacterium]
MKHEDFRRINVILARGREIYTAQKRFGADPKILEADRAYFNAIAYGLLLSALAAEKLSKEFRDRQSQIAWDRVAKWRDELLENFDRVTAQELWLMLEDYAELYGACFVEADSAES